MSDMVQVPEDLLDGTIDFYAEALGLIRDLLVDAERIYEPGFEDPPHIAKARDLADHEGTIAELRRLSEPGEESSRGHRR